MTTLQQYIRENMFCRCEHLVMRLTASNLVPRLDLSPDECEVFEWWLVSKDLANRLRAADLPVLCFTDLFIWGRSALGVPLENDMELIDAIGSLPPSDALGRQVPGWH